MKILKYFFMHLRKKVEMVFAQSMYVNVWNVADSRYFGYGTLMNHVFYSCHSIMLEMIASCYSLPMGPLVLHVQHDKGVNLLEHSKNHTSGT